MQSRREIDVHLYRRTSLFPRTLEVVASFLRFVDRVVCITAIHDRTSRGDHLHLLSRAIWITHLGHATVGVGRTFKPRCFSLMSSLSWEVDKNLCQDIPDIRFIEGIEKCSS